MAESAGKVFEVKIDALVYGGNAMGRLDDGRAVFVPYALPGERVRLRLVKEKQYHAIAELIEVLEPSPERIKPVCQHFATCGGCHYQHLPYQKQLEVKSNIIVEQLQRIAKIEQPPVQPIVPSSNPWNYRNTVQFHLSERGKIGYLKTGSHNVVEIQECHLPEEALNKVWPYLDLEAMPELEKLSLRSGVNEDMMLVLESKEIELPSLELDASISAVHLSPAGSIVMAGDQSVVMEVLGRPFQVSAGSFFQVNIAQAGAMVNHLLELLPLDSDTTLIDLYCGVGLFSAFLAPHVKDCVGIEISPSACEDFAVNLDEFDNISLYQGSARKVLPFLKVVPDIMLVDPPRAGLNRKVLDAVVKMQVPVLAYVSCDPSTLSRDAKRLIEGGYKLKQVTPFDLFPQTYHIESISLFSLAG